MDQIEHNPPSFRQAADAVRRRGVGPSATVPFLYQGIGKIEM